MSMSTYSGRVCDSGKITQGYNLKKRKYFQNLKGLKWANLVSLACKNIPYLIYQS